MKYYDQLSPSCPGCGWFGHGEYVDGTPYCTCNKYGYILNRETEEGCKDFRTPVQVERERKMIRK